MHRRRARARSYAPSAAPRCYPGRPLRATPAALCVQRDKLPFGLPTNVCISLSLFPSLSPSEFLRCRTLSLLTRQPGVWHRDRCRWEMTRLSLRVPGLGARLRVKLPRPAGNSPGIMISNPGRRSFLGPATSLGDAWAWDPSHDLVGLPARREAYPTPTKRRAHCSECCGPCPAAG